MMAETVLTDWKSRHPFKVGQVVWPKAGSPYLSATPHRPRTVSMRGESSLGLWITFEGIAYEFPVSHFTVLEDDAGAPVVTKLLAQLAGHGLVALDPSDPLDPHLHLARIIKETGDVTSAMSQALADGRISPSEARALRSEADAAILVLQELTAQLTTAISEGSGQ